MLHVRSLETFLIGEITKSLNIRENDLCGKHVRPCICFFRARLSLNH